MATLVARNKSTYQELRQHMKSALIDLDDLGILRTTKVPDSYAWMGEAHIKLLLTVMAAGEGGLGRRTVERLFSDDQDQVRELELRDYVKWEVDRFGKLSHLTLTWKGDDAAQTLVKVVLHSQESGVPLDLAISQGA